MPKRERIGIASFDLKKRKTKSILNENERKKRREVKREKTIFYSNDMQIELLFGSFYAYRAQESNAKQKKKKEFVINFTITG